MKKILWLGGMAISLFIFFHLTQSALAYEGQCHLEHCFVPAPTLLIPGDGATVTTTRPVIRGLTWKAAIAQIYLDGVELKNVLQKEHQDFFSGLFVVPDFDLAPGPHVLYAIAHSEKPGWGDQSIESTYIDFTVVLPKTKAVLAPQAAAPVKLTALATVQPSLEKKIEPNNQEALASASLNIIEMEKNSDQFAVIATQTKGQVEVKGQGAIGGGVAVVEEEAKTATNSLQTAAGLSDLGEILKDEFKEPGALVKARANRLIGLVMLAIILLVGLVWLIVGRERRLKKLLSKQPANTLPSILQPSARSEPVEETTAEDLSHYQVSPEWGSGEKIPSPPASPSSPYPSPSQSDSNKDQERLGL